MSGQWQARRAASEAAAWLARLDSGQATQEDRRAHRLWLDESPLHREEYAAAQKLFVQAAYLRGLSQLQPAAAVGASRKSIAYRSAVASLAAAAALCAVVLWNYAFVGPVEAQFFSTAVGERREVTLGDGSVVTLNTDSRLRVPEWQSARTVVLERGEAFFAVARDEKRPFIAQGGGGSVRVLGTKFNVRLDGAHASVAVLEGRVELSLSAPAQPDTGQRVLAAGDSATYGTDGTWLRAQRLDTARIMAWRTGKFLFDATPLEEVVREVNRYSQNPVMIADSALADLRISGTFPTDRIPDLLQMLEQALPVHVVTRGDTILLVAR